MSQWQKGEFEVVWPKAIATAPLMAPKPAWVLTQRSMTLGAWLELIASGLITGGVYALVALGLNLQYGLMRILNIAHGEFLMLGAFLTWAAQTSLGISPLRDAAGVVRAADGARPRDPPADASAGSPRTSPNLDVFEARGLMVALRPDVPGAELRAAGSGAATCAATTTWPSRWRSAAPTSPPTSCCCSRWRWLFSAALIVVLRTTLLGKGVRALMQSPTGAQLVGIDTERLHPLMFGVGLGLSGVAGCLLSMTYTISPAMGEPYTVTALIVITLGGFGSMAGALVGGLALGVIEAIGMHFTNPSLKTLLSYGIFIAVLLWRPNGLFARR